MPDKSKFNLYSLVHKYARREINQVGELAARSDFLWERQNKCVTGREVLC